MFLWINHLESSLKIIKQCPIFPWKIIFPLVFALILHSNVEITFPSQNWLFLGRITRHRPPRIQYWSRCICKTIFLRPSAAISYCLGTGWPKTHRQKSSALHVSWYMFNSNTICKLLCLSWNQFSLVDFLAAEVKLISY